MLKKLYKGLGMGSCQGLYESWRALLRMLEHFFARAFDGELWKNPD